MRVLAALLLCLGWAGARVMPFHCPAAGARAAWLGLSGPDAVAWLVAEAPPGSPQATLDPRARALVTAAYRCRADLTEVDLTVVPPGTGTTQAQIFATEPVMTLSVPRGRLTGWLAIAPGHWAQDYDRVWYADAARPVPEVGAAPRGAGGWPLWSRLSADTLGGVQDGVLARGVPWSDRVALTFDDGPHPLYTPLLLSALRREQLGATCFLIGRLARAYPYFVRDLRAAGVEVGNHSYAHLRPQGLTPQDQWRDLMAGQRVLTGLTGRSPRFFRPPGGGVTDQLLAQTRAAGLILALWSDDPADYALGGRALLLARLHRHLTRGGVLLLHDNAPGVLAALPDLAREARRRGLTVGALGELLPQGGAPRP